jgi:hypothetical protein
MKVRIKPEHDRGEGVESCEETPGPNYTPDSDLDGPPGRCQKWGCLLPVGRDSVFGRGPVCDVCRWGLRK